MKKLAQLAIALASTTICLGTAYATSIPNTDTPTTFLGPTLRAGYTSTINNTTAYSIAGEAGIRNLRIDGTLGFKLSENQLFKLSAEYLRQNIIYSYFSGNTDQWVNQGALGAAYQYEWTNYSYQPQFNISAYASHAPSKTLHTDTGEFFNASLGAQNGFTDERRLAGSNAAGISPGISVAPWMGGRVGLELNYDNVRYDTKYTDVNQDATGFGGTITVGQVVNNDVDFHLSAAARQPFNTYGADVNWKNFQYHGDWSLGLFGNYTSGKNTLPDTWNLGVSADYSLDRRCPEVAPANLKGERNLKDEMVSRPIQDHLLAWTARPAVYMPQVLALVDERVNANCGTPVSLLGQIPDVNFGSPTTQVVVQSAPYFSGSNITYSVSAPDAAAQGVGGGFNPQTGEITFIFPSGNDYGFITTVTATNGCNSVSTSFTVSGNN